MITTRAISLPQIIAAQAFWTPDAEAVVEGLRAREGVEYSALWFNESGLQRALAFRGKLTLAGFISLSASGRLCRT